MSSIISNKTGGYYYVYRETPHGAWSTTTSSTDYIAPPAGMVYKPKITSNTHRQVLGLVTYPRSSREGAGDNSIVHSISFANVKELLAKFFLTCRSEMGVPNWRNYCIGVASSVSHGFVPVHMPMLDYDGRGIANLVREDVDKIQRQFGLGPAWIYKTKRGFHVYFGTDLKSSSDYFGIAASSQCCKGFRKYLEANGYSVLRVSAKYTEFDLAFQEIIPGPNIERPARRVWPFVIVQELIKSGAECKTHLASLYPQWAPFKEDPVPWKPKSTYRKLVTKGAEPEAWTNPVAGAADPANVIDPSVRPAVVKFPGIRQRATLKIPEYNFQVAAEEMLKHYEMTAAFSPKKAKADLP